MGQSLSTLPNNVATIIARRLPRNKVRCVLRLVHRELRDVVDALFDDVVVHLFEEGLPARELRWFLLDAATSESVVERMDFAQRVRLMRTAASTGDADTLRLAQSRCRIFPPSSRPPGQHRVYSHFEYCNDVKPVLHAALRSCTTTTQARELVGLLLGPLAQLPIVQCEIVKGCMGSPDDVLMAFVEDLKRFDSDEDYRTACVCAVAYSCDLATLQGFLERPGASWDVDNVLREAVKSPTADWQDKLRAVEAASRPDVPHLDPAHLCSAAACAPGAIERLQWLQGQGYMLEPGTIMYKAITRNPAESADILRYLNMREHSSLHAVLCVAARHGNVAVVEALKTDMEADKEMFSLYAVQLGNVDVLRAAGISDAAAFRTHFGNSFLHGKALMAGNIAFLEMFHDLLDPPPQLDADMWKLALCSRNPRVLHWLRDKGCPLPHSRLDVHHSTHAYMLDTLRQLGVAFDVRPRV